MFADINLGPRQKLTMVHLMPITDAEARLVARKGFPALIDRFGLGDGFEREHVDESLLVDVMDLHRLDDLGVESS